MRIPAVSMMWWCVVAIELAFLVGFNEARYAGSINWRSSKDDVVVLLKPGCNASEFVRNMPGLSWENLRATYRSSKGDVVVASNSKTSAALLKQNPQVVIAEASIDFTVTPSVAGADSVITTPWSVMASQILGYQVNNAEQWHLDRMDQPSNVLNGWYNVTDCGTNVNIYMVDTGVNTNLPEFEGRALQFFPPGNASDFNGHGTFTAALAAGKKYGAAKCATIQAVRVLDPDGSGDTSSVIQGLDYVLNKRDKSKPSIVSMSLAGSGRSQIVEWYVAALLADNVLVVTAAGNSDNGDNACNYSPGASDSSLTVGASDQNDAATPWSNSGPCVKIFAPGRDVYGIDESGLEQAWNGTSMATPLVSGTAALLWGLQPTLTAQQVFRGVLSNAVGGTMTVPANTINLLVQSRFNVAPAPTSSEWVTMAGNALSTCDKGCNIKTKDSAAVVGGILSRGSGKQTVFQPQSNLNLAYSVNDLTGYANEKFNKPGIYFVNDEALIYSSDRSVSKVTGVTFVPETMTLYFRDDQQGLTFYWSKNSAVVYLNSNQLQWLYSWRTGNFVRDRASGILWFRGLEGFFDSTRRRFFIGSIPGSSPVGYQNGADYYFGVSQFYWLGGTYNVDRRFFIGSCGSWCGSYGQVPYGWANSSDSTMLGSANRRFFIGSTMFVSGTDLLTSSNGQIVSISRNGVVSTYTSLGDGAGVWQTLSARSERTFGASGWSAPSSTFYASPADFNSSNPGMSSFNWTTTYSRRYCWYC